MKENRSEGFRHKKSLGQNFLSDEVLLENLVDLSGVGKEDRILEIGTGEGSMTHVLSRRCERVITIELDQALIPILRVSFQRCPNVQLVQGDVMRLNLPEITKDLGEFHVVANIPYYLTSDLMNLLFASSMPIRSINVMVQKEAAERLTAQPGVKEYSALSVRAQYYGNPEIVLDVPRGLFTPPPNVDSAFVTMPLQTSRRFFGDYEKLFLKIVNAAFAMRRKTLMNNLTSAFAIDRDRAKVWLERSGIDITRRGETLTQKEFFSLTESFTIDSYESRD